MHALCDNEIKNRVKSVLALGSLEPAHFAALAFDPGDHEVVVRRGLVAHPGDDGGLGAALDRDALGPRHGAAPDRRGVRRHPRRELDRERGPPRREAQERGHLGAR